MEEMAELAELSEAMLQAAALLADEDVDGRSSRRSSTFLNVVAIGNVGAGKSAVLNSLIGHPILPTGENGATRVPICVDLQSDSSVNSRTLVLVIDNKQQQVSASSLRHSLQDRLSKAAASNGPVRRQDEIYLKLLTSTAPPLKLIDLPGLDQRAMDESTVSDYAARSDAILLVVIPASQAPEIASSRALRMAKEFDSDGTRTVGVISKVDQASGEAKSIAAVQALLLNQGPRSAAEIPWVALIGQTVSLASSQPGSAGSENSLETAWKAESESLKSIISGAPPNKLGRVALVDVLAKQIRNRMKVRVPNLLNGLQGKSQIVQDQLVRLGEQMVQSSEGTRALALELCREFEEKFLQHIATGEGSGWKIVACFEGSFPNRMKQLPLDRHFDMNNVKRIVLEADGYQPYLISPEKGLRSLIKGVLELAKEPSRLCVDEVHHVLMDILSAAANATPGLSRYPPFKREIISVATAALDGFKNEAKKMVVSLVDMERAFVPPQHFIRLVQRRMERQRKEDELKARPPNQVSSKKEGDGQAGASSKTAKDKSEKDAAEASTVQVVGNSGEITAGYLLKRSVKNNEWKRRWFVVNEKSGKLGYTKTQEEKNFRGVIVLEECTIEEVADDEEPAKSSKDKKSKKSDAEKGPNLVFKISSKIQYKTVVKTRSALILKAENAADKVVWMNKIRSICDKGGPAKGPSNSEGGPPLRQSRSDGSLESMPARPADPEEELRWMSQEVRGYVEAVLNSLAANVPKAIVLCQVEKAKEDMLNQLYSSVSALPTPRVEELVQEDQNVKVKRERFQKQSALLSKLTRQLGIHEGGDSESLSSAGSESSPRQSSGDEWRSAFDGSANGPSDTGPSSASRRKTVPPENGDSSSSRRTPNRMPPAPPPGNSSGSRY